mmetsp:Transcript_2395/g.3181  ORF Transcript_2395/g.3181 Transcript_2395/m.3181 type:complete len:216 (+) Transcript_2395:173-820(+)
MVLQRGVLKSLSLAGSRSSMVPSASFSRAFDFSFSSRWYRGDSGDMKHRRELTQDEVGKREEALFEIASPKFELIQERHISMPTLDNIPEASLPFDMVGSKLSKEELELDVRKKRLVYRSKQRGWLEVDLLLGTWAKQNVPSLAMDELNQFEAFVNMETIDIYNVITLRTDVPDEMKRSDGSGVVERIQEWARSSPLGKGDPDKYSSVKRANNLI